MAGRSFCWRKFDYTKIPSSWTSHIQCACNIRTLTRWGWGAATAEHTRGWWRRGCTTRARGWWWGWRCPAHHGWRRRRGCPRSCRNPALLEFVVVWYAWTVVLPWCNLGRRWGGGKRLKNTVITCILRLRAKRCCPERVIHYDYRYIEISNSRLNAFNVHVSYFTSPCNILHKFLVKFIHF